VTHNTAPVKTDGGYHAIRGFAFQFDATILEAFADPEAPIGIEGEQDIDIENFYIQVKLRSQGFLLSRAAVAVRQILEQFSCNTDRRYRLYCYFEDREPGIVLKLDEEQLDKLLGADRSTYDNEVKKLFVDRFEIKFAPDFEAQFLAVLEHLKARHSLKTDEEAIAYHAILSHHLTNLVLTKSAGLRITSARQLDVVVRNSERAIFLGRYRTHLGKRKYLALLRSQMPPGSKTANMPKRQRLVIAEVEADCDVHDLVDLASAVSTRFYVPENSPQPFLLLRTTADPTSFKRALWDAKVMFSDGTHFDGDRFRLEDLTGAIHSSIRLRLVHESKLAELMGAVRLQEVYDFYSTRPLLASFEGPRIRRMSIETIADAVRVMEVRHRS